MVTQYRYIMIKTDSKFSENENNNNISTQWQHQMAINNKLTTNFCRSSIISFYRPNAGAHQHHKSSK